jgi:electron transfer flavoprotein beta subunit
MEDMTLSSQEKNQDYNGGMVPGMISGILGYNFVNSVHKYNVEGTTVKQFVKSMEVKKQFQLLHH